jgi:hypothetical protein
MTCIGRVKGALDKLNKRPTLAASGAKAFGPRARFGGTEKAREAKGPTRRV